MVSVHNNNHNQNSTDAMFRPSSQGSRRRVQICSTDWRLCRERLRRALNSTWEKSIAIDAQSPGRRLLYTASRPDTTLSRSSICGSEQDSQLLHAILSISNTRHKLTRDNQEYTAGREQSEQVRRNVESRLVTDEHWREVRNGTTTTRRRGAEQPRPRRIYATAKSWGKANRVQLASEKAHTMCVEVCMHKYG